MLQAMTMAGVIGAGETPTTDEATTMLFQAQAMFDEWSGMEIVMFATRTAVVTLASGTVSYAIPGTRPVKILSADAVISGQNYPVDVLGPDAWAALPHKSDTASLPRAIYCDYAYTTPAVLVAPIPNAVATLNLYCTVALPALFATTGTTFAAPEGLLSAVLYNLAVLYCIAFVAPVPAALAAKAAESLGALKALAASNRAGKSTLAVPQLEGK